MKYLFYFRILFSTLILVFVSGCSLISSQEKAGNLDIVFDTKEELSFEGKGAGAGIALMSTMGPMGMAIGVAIDAGIAKDLNESLNKSPTNLNTILIQEGSLYFDNVSIIDESVKQAQNHQLIISKMGFHTVSGKNDPACMKIEATFVNKDGVKKKISYPDLTDDKKNECIAAPLSDLKSNSDLIADTVRQSIAQLLRSIQKN